eukprot:1013694-Pelagomonas_calceolata.AAC.8
MLHARTEDQMGIIGCENILKTTQAGLPETKQQKTTIHAIHHGPLWSSLVQICKPELPYLLICDEEVGHEQVEGCPGNGKHEGSICCTL